MAEPSAPEPPKPPEAPQPAPAKAPMSKEAWVGISAITAAAITGIVSLITHFTPSPGPVATPPTATPSPAPQTTPVDGMARLVGKWSGQAESAQGKFQIDLEISPTCAEGQPCGIIRVSNVPCYGNVSLHRVQSGEYEFSVDSFRPGSSKSCTAGAGEYFVPSADGKLIYRTDYDSSIHGTLSKLP